MVACSNLAPFPDLLLDLSCFVLGYNELFAVLTFLAGDALALFSVQFITILCTKDLVLL